MGPYQSMEEAKRGLQTFMEFTRIADLETMAKLTDYLSPAAEETAEK